MVELLNNASTQYLISSLKIRHNIASKIFDSLPISRFHELRGFDSVGKQSYEKIFKLVYAQALNKKANDTRLIKPTQFTLDLSDP